jgi:hypothetical protein
MPGSMLCSVTKRIHMPLRCEQWEAPRSVPLLCEQWRMLRSLRAAVLPLLICCSLPLTGCDRQKTPPSSADAAQLGSPRAVYDQLRRWHAGHSYLSMMPWIHPSARDDVIELLVAVDELTLANTSAQVAITQSCPGINPRDFDMSAISNFLDLFSRDAEFVGEKIEGDNAVVTIQVAHRLPLKQLRFQRHEGQWVYLPGSFPVGLTEAIRLLAKGMNRFATVIAQNTCSPEQVDTEFRYRVVPKLDAFRKLMSPATAPASQVAR